MQVYLELALIENFCMDFTLLTAAKFTAKNACAYWRIAVASALGACFAAAFPLFGLAGAWAVVIKILSGLLMCLLAGKFNSVKNYVKFSGWFLIFTALSGGALVGIFMLAGVDYLSGEGYLLSSVPIGIPLFFVMSAALGARRLAKKLTKGEKNAVTCKIVLNGKQVELKGFFDSGNKVYSGGAPVSVIPKSAAQKLIDETGIKDGVVIHTVAGSQIMKIFTADRIEFEGGKNNIIKKVKIGISPQNIDRAVLHCDLLEDLCLKK